MVRLIGDVCSRRSSAIRAGLVALSLSLLTAPASAQKVVVFGDSLSDTGNAQVATSGTNPGSPYGRYSNGLNWVDQLYGTGANGIGLNPFSAHFGFNPNSFAFSYGAGGGGIPPGNVLDYAFGGAYTGTGNIGNGTAPGTAGTAPGVTQEVQLFALLGGHFTAQDTVTMWAGANNGFWTINVPGANQTSIATGAFTAVGSEIANLQSLIGLGAKRLLVLNIPDLGVTPAVSAGGANAIQGGNLFSTVFNAGLQQGLGQLAGAAPGVNIIQADVNSVVRYVLANPTAFGFTNTTGFCGFNGGAACNGYFFADSVHPSQAAYGLLDVYINQLLNPTPALQQVARFDQSGIYANEMITNAVYDRLTGFVSGAYVAKNGPYVEVLGSYAQYNSSGSSPGLSQSIGGVRAGIDKKSGATLSGASVSYIDGSQSSGSIQNDIQSWRADVYGTALYGNAYVSADAGISSLALNGIKRDTGFPTLQAQGETSGYVATASAEAGYVQQMGGLALIPSARATYYHSQVNGYDESAPFLAMSFADSQIDALALGGKIRMAANVPGIGLAAVGFGEIGYEGFVSSSQSALRASFVGNTALPTIVNPGDVMNAGLLGKVGLSAQVTPNMFVDLQYGIAVHDVGGQTHSGDLRIKATY